jgi:hypothetical protein
MKGTPTFLSQLVFEGDFFLFYLIDVLLGNIYWLLLEYGFKSINIFFLDLF